jgi:hypothetical protein
MRFTQYFCGNESVGELLSQFRCSQGPVFHYTGRDASIGITCGEIWMTRADCFLDQAEIAHGLAVLSEAAQTTLEEERESFSTILEVLRARLASCFVLSLSQDQKNEHLRKVYSGSDGAILEFQEDFPRTLYTGWHAIPKGDDSWSLHYVVDLYDFFEGFVVYDPAQKRRLAEMACQSYRSLRSTDAHIVDSHHFIDVLMQCMILFKTPEHEAEVEYRVALIGRGEESKPFEQSRSRSGSRRQVFTRVLIPKPKAAAIRSRDVQS